MPLRLPAGARVLLLSMIDYASGWREGAPGRVFVPELKKRFADVTAVEVSDRTTAAEMDLIRALARRSDAVVAATYVRIASSSGRMGLAGRSWPCSSGWRPTRRSRSWPWPSAARTWATSPPKVPALLLTYEWTTRRRRRRCARSAARRRSAASCPSPSPASSRPGHGLERAAVAPGAPIASAGPK